MLEKLFVYGFLLDAPKRTRLLGRDPGLAPARLPGYRRGRGRYFFVEPNAGTEVEGGILSGLDVSDFEILDRYEEVPALYTRETVDVIDARGQTLRCWIYLPTGWERNAK